MLSISETKMIDNICDIASLGYKNKMSWMIMSDLKSEEPVNVAKVLHFEGRHKLSLFSLKEGGVVGKDHEIVDIKSNDAKEAPLAVDAVDEDGMVRERTIEVEFP